ncbi:DUF1214 domain-containing protein [Chelativorans sp. SCAU2101]|jgi:hypothetical protein|uniref:DUF1214 domain-containing protein n=1 Tax=Chelativorans petroleitrophicus TaxID=2975484 RepID=A0A9X3B7F2_9HYPH|nr:DUF1214 domain-containing protein [Chelativorans petroleitrophicus]MCT8991643.1 DUF1214 domain-containing protein [Chelativorans petroleitrophicus]
MLRTVLFAIFVLAIAIGGGAASVWAVLEKAPLGGTRVKAPWIALPSAGSPEANPYTRARLAREGGVPLGSAEGMAFLAARDSGGALLDRSCTYSIEGIIPVARLWTLHAIAPSGALLASLGRRKPALHSRMVLYQPEGSIAITVSTHPSPGNWLALTGSGPFELVLTLLDPSVTTPGESEMVLPQIVQVGCDG